MRARFLGLAELGFYGLITGATTIVPAVFGFGLTDWIGRKIVGLKSSEAIPYITSRLGVSLAMHLIMQPIVWLANVALGEPLPWTELWLIGSILLVKAANSISASVKIIGDGEDRESIQLLSTDTEITGWMAHANALTQLRDSRALVFPSLLYETQGLAGWEAASQGIPSIVADTTAAVEGVRDGITGLHFKGGDWQNLAEKMQILQDPQIAQRMGRAAYEEYWRNPMTPKRHARELIASYDIILHKHQ